MRKFLALAVLLVAAPMASQAAPLALNSGWQGFDWSGYVAAPFDRTFEFTVAAGETAALRVTDAFLSGDQFLIYNYNPIFGTLGLTSSPTSFGDSTTSYDVAFADSRWSSGQWLLGAGAYSIRGLATLSPFGGGAGALRVDRISVSEPSALVLIMLAGFAAFFFMRRSSVKK
ncbi:MAG: PEP-CTERM sorting domain-containing protein [Pseudomonadales bacterium]|nr:PEP-CTERM sorting domain-containing protein [Pseudomonadales bacterium]